jgi:acylphosphatase
VFFRVRAAEKARALGLCGWVRNLPDGRVEALVEGPAQAVEAMTGWCRTGPPGASVAAVDVEQLDPSGSETDFRIIH